MKNIELTKNEIDNLWNVVFTSTTLKQDIVLTIDLEQLCNDLVGNFSSSVLTKGQELDITSLSIAMKLIFIILRKKVNQLTSINTNQIIPSDNLTLQKQKKAHKKPRKVIPVTFKPISKITAKNSATQLKEFEFGNITQDSDLGKLSVFNTQNALEIDLNSEDFEVARASFQDELLNSHEVPRDDFNDDNHFENFNNNDNMEDFNGLENSSQMNDTTNNMLSLNKTANSTSKKTSKSFNKLNKADNETLISAKKIKRQLKNTKNIIKELKYSEKDEEDYVIKEEDFLKPFANMIQQSMNIIKCFNMNRQQSEIIDNSNNINIDNMSKNENSAFDESGITLGNFQNLGLEGDNFDMGMDNNDFGINDDFDMNGVEDVDNVAFKEYDVKTTFGRETVGFNKKEAGREFMNVLESVGNGKVEIIQKQDYGEIIIKPVN